MASDKRQRGNDLDSMDLNRAKPDELEDIEGIDSQRARAIVEYRRKNGPFRSWEDVERVPGIGRTLREKLQSFATLGAQSQAAKPRKSRTAESAGASAETETAIEEESAGSDEEIEAAEVGDEGVEGEALADEEEPELVALQALAEMDLGAAAGYEIAARCFEGTDETVSKQLLAFREDHLRHVENLERLVKAMGGEAVEREDAAQSVLARLAEAAEALGTRAAILAMISTEHLTNSTYDAILELEWDDEVRKVLQRNLEDERRHLQWLEQNRERFAEEQAPPEARA